MVMLHRVVSFFFHVIIVAITVNIVTGTFKALQQRLTTLIWRIEITFRPSNFFADNREIYNTPSKSRYSAQDRKPTKISSRPGR